METSCFVLYSEHNIEQLLLQRASKLIVNKRKIGERRGKLARTQNKGNMYQSMSPLTKASLKRCVCLKAGFEVGKQVCIVRNGVGGQFLA